MKQFILDPGARRVNRKVNRVDVALWEVEKEAGSGSEKGQGKGEGKEVLLVATNLNYEGTVVELKELGIDGGGSGRQVFDSGGKAEGRQLVFESVGSAAWIFR